MVWPSRLSRREFLRRGAVLAAVGPDLVTAGPDDAARYLEAARRLTDTFQSTFWDPAARMYRAPQRSAETVDSDPQHNNGYVLWPSVEALHALVEANRSLPGRYRAALREVFGGLERYFDAERKAYNAWLNFPGNNDTYYDDNAIVVIALTKAFRVTRAKAYIDRAWDVMSRFCLSGWDDGEPGGVRWGTDPTRAGTADRAACSTGLAALAALLLADTGVAVESNIEWGRRALQWLVEHLLDTDGLVMDALEPPDWRLRRVKWTYNTGIAICAHVLLYRLATDTRALGIARRLADATLHRGGALYDSLVHDMEHRFLYDSSYFVPWVIEGWLALYRETRDPLLLREAQRHADFALDYVRDPADGLFFRNWRLWRISEEQLRMWERLTGQEGHLDPDEDERSKASGHLALPVAQRPLVKTLLANAGCARLLWLVGRASR